MPSFARANPSYIWSIKGAHNAILDLEELTQQDLDRFLKCYQKLAHEARKHVREGLKDTDTPEVKARESAA